MRNIETFALICTTAKSSISLTVKKLDLFRGELHVRLLIEEKKAYLAKGNFFFLLTS